MPSYQQSAVTNELDLYFDSHPSSDDVMPLDWQKVYKSEYPVLSKMAKDYLAIMSTSVSCEQFFSIARKQITQT